MKLQIPFRSRDDSLIAVAGLARELEGDDRRVVRQVALDAYERGAGSVGELLDSLEAMAPEQRRDLVNDARAKLNLPPVAEDARARADLRSSVAQVPRCAVTDCPTVPVRPGGGLYHPDVRRWWCPAHAHLAGPGDLEPAGTGVRMTASGALVPVDPADDAREAAVLESERRRREQRFAEREGDAARVAEHHRARDAQAARETPTGAV